MNLSKNNSRSSPITVVISTNGKRKNKLLNCLNSIRDGNLQATQMLVLQQGRTALTLPSWVISLEIPHRGVSFSKNTAINMCQTPLIAFIDDDCIADKNWLKKIALSLEDPDISAVYGQAIPYPKTQKKNHICPSYMLKTVKERTQSFNLGKTHFGIGCNMAFKVNVLREINGFKEWLGPGTEAYAAEDIELLFRLFMKKKILLYDPEIKIYHDRWLTFSQNRKQYHEYYCGMLATYSYHMFHGNTWALKIVKDLWKKKIQSIFKNPKFYLGKSALKNLCFDLIDLAFFIKGTLIACFERYFEKANYDIIRYQTIDANKKSNLPRKKTGKSLSTGY